MRKMMKPKISINELILTKNNEAMLVISRDFKNDEWYYLCKNTLNDGTKVRQNYRETEIKYATRGIDDMCTCYADIVKV